MKKTAKVISGNTVLDDKIEGLLEFKNVSFIYPTRPG
jgi:hypothetical protein